MKTRRVTVIQIPYNPLQREVERLILPLAVELGLGVIVMRPFAEGSLVRTSPPASGVEATCPVWGSTWPQVLLKWVTERPTVSCGHSRDVAAGDGWTRTRPPAIRRGLARTNATTSRVWEKGTVPIFRNGSGSCDVRGATKIVRHLPDS